MNKSLQVNGGISSYSNKPLYANRGVNARGNISASGNISSRNGLTVTGGRTYIKDAENKGRLRVGAAWGVPGLYSEDRQDIVVGCHSSRSVHLGRPNLVKIDARGNIHLPKGANIYVGGKPAYIKHADSITLRSHKDGRRLQNHSNRYGRFDNFNQGGWEKFHIEKCGGGTAIGRTGMRC